MKRTDADEMKVRILEAAIKCKINAQGNEVALAQVAYRSGISERTLNRYFPDKEMMFYEAAIRYLRLKYERFSEQFLNADTKEMNGIDKLLLMIRMQVDNYQQDPLNAKIFVRAFTTALRTAVYRNLPPSGFDASTKQMVISFVEEGIQDGSIRCDCEPLDIYFLISSNFIGLVQRMIYIYSVELTKKEHDIEFAKVFNQYLIMVREFLNRDVA